MEARGLHSGGCRRAAAGLPPRADHAFNAAELTELFEQLVVQLHDFPTPPPLYRPQDGEPALVSTERIRVISGFSGAGKTSWVSQAALHTVGDVFYFNVIDIPSTALVSTISRELAGHLFGGKDGTLGQVLLPGSTGGEILLAINRQLKANGATATLVIDNAHRVAADDIRALTTGCDQLSFVLLCQPSPTVQELEARLAIRTEELRGWTTDTIAAEGQSCGCHGGFATYERVRATTGGLPLYVQNALRIAANEYGGDVARFCAEIEAQTHLTETAQELILRRAFAEFGAADRAGLGALALSETPLDRDDMTSLLKAAASLSDTQIAALLRRARSTGLVQFYGGDRIKVHDAVRTIARAGLTEAGAETAQRAQLALKNVLITSIQKSWSLKMVSQLMRTFVTLGEIKPLVSLATDELFHEMGIMPEITAFLEQAAVDDPAVPPLGEYVRALRQGLQRWSVDLLQQRAAGHAEPPDRPLLVIGRSAACCRAPRSSISMAVSPSLRAGLVSGVVPGVERQPLKTGAGCDGTVTIDRAVHERFVDQLDVDAAVLHGLGGMGDLHQLARGDIRIGEGAALDELMPTFSQLARREPSQNWLGCLHRRQVPFPRR